MRRSNKAHSSTLVQTLLLRLHFTASTHFDIFWRLLLVLILLLREPADLVLLLVRQNSICIALRQKLSSTDPHDCIPRL